MWHSPVRWCCSTRSRLMNSIRWRRAAPFYACRLLPRCLRDAFPPYGTSGQAACAPAYICLLTFLRQVQRGLLNVMRAYLERPACYELCCAGHVHLLMYRLLAAAPHVLLTAEENARTRAAERAPAAAHPFCGPELYAQDAPVRFCPGRAPSLKLLRLCKRGAWDRAS